MTNEVGGDVVLHRRTPAIMVINAADSILMYNGPSAAILRELAHRAGEPAILEKLPRVLAELVNLLRSTLASTPGSSPVAPLTADTFVRACHVHGFEGEFLLLSFEHPRRRDSNLNLDPFHLSPREREIATLIVRGYSNKGIAERLGLTEHTVGSYLKQIFIKVGVHTRAALVATVLGWERRSINLVPRQARQ